MKNLVATLIIAYGNELEKLIIFSTTTIRIFNYPSPTEFISKIYNHVIELHILVHFFWPKNLPVINFWNFEEVQIFQHISNFFCVLRFMKKI